MRIYFLKYSLCFLSKICLVCVTERFGSQCDLCFHHVENICADKLKTSYIYLKDFFVLQNAKM